jgi:hypothetical protein
VQEKVRATYVYFDTVILCQALTFLIVLLNSKVAHCSKVLSKTKMKHNAKKAVATYANFNV